MEGALSTLTPYSYGDRSVRIVARDGEAWFVATDVCAVLEIANPRDAVSKLDDDEKGVVLTDTLGGPQNSNVISEPGLYALILRSRKPEAKRFSRWVRHEVLPAIRRTGAYGVPTMTVGAKLKLLAAAERLGGKLAARELWSRLDLPPMATFAATAARRGLSSADIVETAMRRIPSSGVVSRRDLFRAMPRGVSAVDFDAAVDTLVSEGRVVATPTTVGRVGRPSVLFSRREG